MNIIINHIFITIKKIKLNKPYYLVILVQADQFLQLPVFPDKSYTNIQLHIKYSYFLKLLYFSKLPSSDLASISLFFFFGFKNQLYKNNNPFSLFLFPLFWVWEYSKLLGLQCITCINEFYAWIDKCTLGFWSREQTKWFDINYQYKKEQQ